MATDEAPPAGGGATPVLVADRYRLDEVLGTGGVGRVWRGSDTVLRRPVAVKEVPLPGHLADRDRTALRARVLREARAAARIHHPGSVQVFDVIDGDDTVWIVMELVEDPTLADVVEREGPLSPHATAAMGVELLGALEAAHQVGIVHRDVKPRNVMVAPSGAVKLADFGVATLHDDPSLTETGMVLGTPSYMSPEQALGREVGPPSDVWGTGALLYHAVEGVAPFDRGEPIATLHAVVHDEPRPYERAGGLGPIITELLAKDPDERIALHAARSRLAGVADGAPAPTTTAAPTTAAPTTAGPVTGVGRLGPAVSSAATTPSRSSERWRPLALLGGVLAILLLGGVAIAQTRSDGPGTAAGSVVGDEADVEDDGAVAPEDPVDTEPPSTLTTEVPTTVTPPTTPPETAPPETAPPETTPAPVTTTPPPPPPAAGRPAGVPDSWQRYTGPVGWTIWHPPTWDPVSGPGNAVDFRDPGSGAYLRVDQTPTPGDDPVAAWNESSGRFATRFDDYRELGIRATTYQGYDAALWEYAYQGQQASNLGFVTPGRGYALNFQTSAGAWSGAQGVRQAFEAGFAVPG